TWIVLLQAKRLLLDGALLPALWLSRRLLPESVPTAVLATLPAVLPVRARRCVLPPAVRRRWQREVVVVVDADAAGAARSPLVSALSRGERHDPFPPCGTDHG